MNDTRYRWQHDTEAARRAGRLYLDPDDLGQTLWADVWVRLERYADLVDHGEERLINFALSKVASAYVRRERDLRLPDWQSDSGQQVAHLMEVLVNGRSPARDMESLLAPPSDQPDDSREEQADLLAGPRALSEDDRRVLLVRAAHPRSWADACDMLDTEVESTRKRHTRALRRLVASMSDREAMEHAA